MLLDLGLDYLFYRSIWFAFLLCPVIPLFLVFMRNRCLRQRKKQLRVQFRDAMQSITAALQAGYSIENATREALVDMQNMYGETGMISRELQGIYEALRNSRTPEEMFSDFGERSGLEEISDFAEVFEIAKRSGGDLPGVIRVSTETISGKIETEGEIETAIASKRMEGRIMDLLPCIILLYIDVTSPGYFDMLYTTLAGRVVMTVCLLGYVGAIALSEKLMRIEV